MSEHTNAVAIYAPEQTYLEYNLGLEQLNERHEATLRSVAEENAWKYKRLWNSGDFAYTKVESVFTDVNYIAGYNLFTNSEQVLSAFTLAGAAGKKDLHAWDELNVAFAKHGYSEAFETMLNDSGSSRPARAALKAAFDIKIYEAAVETLSARKLDNIQSDLAEILSLASSDGARALMANGLDAILLQRIFKVTEPVNSLAWVHKAGPLQLAMSTEYSRCAVAEFVRMYPNGRGVPGGSISFAPDITNHKAWMFAIDRIIEERLIRGERMASIIRSLQRQHHPDTTLTAKDVEAITYINRIRRATTRKAA